MTDLIYIAMFHLIFINDAHQVEVDNCCKLEPLISLSPDRCTPFVLESIRPCIFGNFLRPETLDLPEACFGFL